MLKKIIMCCFVITTLLAAKTEKELIAEVTAIGDKVHEKIMAGNFDYQLKYYTDDCIVMPDYRPMATGKKEFKVLLDEDNEHGNKFHNLDGHVTKIWECGNKVFEQGNLFISISNKYVSQPIALNGSYFTIWERQSNGKLLIKYYIWNTDHKIR